MATRIEKANGAYSVHTWHHHAATGSWWPRGQHFNSADELVAEGSEPGDGWAELDDKVAVKGIKADIKAYDKEGLIGVAQELQELLDSHS